MQSNHSIRRRKLRYQKLSHTWIKIQYQDYPIKDDNIERTP